MGIDHGGLYVFVPEKLLNGADTCTEPQVRCVVTVLKKVGGETVTKNMRRHGFVYFGELGSLFDGSLEIGFIQMVTLLNTADGINGECRGWEDILPGKFTAGIGVFSFESIGEVDRAIALREINIMLCFHLLEMKAQWLHEQVGKHGNTIIFAFSIADNDLSIGKVQVFYAQAHDFHEAQSTAIHDLRHNLVHTIHFFDHFFGFVFGENGGDAFRFGGANGKESSFIQLNA